MEKIPKVLLVGDSISIGYSPYVASELKGEVRVRHNEGNASDSAHLLSHLDAYLAADQTDEIETRYAEMLDAYDEFEDKHLLRRRLIYVAGIIYLANIADAVFQFPESGDGYFAGAMSENPGFYASVEPDAVTLGVNVPF